MERLPPEVIALFARNRGLAARWELQAIEIRPDTIASWALCGLLDRLMDGVYRLAGVDVPLLDISAAVRYLNRPTTAPGAEARLSGADALALRQYEGFGHTDRPLFVVPHGRRVRLREALFTVAQRILLPGDLATVDGVLTVAPGYALADVALDASVPDKVLRVGFDEARRRGHLRRDRWVERLRTMAGHAGAARYLGMHDAGVLDQESEGERAAFAALFGQWPPAPDCQVWISRRVRVDFVYLRAALILEYLGEVHADQLLEDADRTWAARTCGYEILPITSRMLRSPEALARRIHDVRHEREALADRGLLRVAPLPEQPHRRTPLATL